MTAAEPQDEEFKRLLRQLDPKHLKMVGLYMHLLVNDRKFQKMPEIDRRALIDRWFKERPSA